MTPKSKALKVKSEGEPFTFGHSFSGKRTRKGFVRDKGKKL
jgi:hypothetical protein